MGGHKDYTLGDLKWSIQGSDHEFWLKCDGRSIKRSLYPALFDLIGTTYGSNDSETFKLPDCRGRVVGCIGNGSGLTPRPAGASVGAETHTLTIGEMPSHNHTINDPGHTHGYQNQAGDNGPTGFTDGADNDEYNQTTASSTTGITINNTGGGGAHNNMQPTIFIGNVFIAYKTKIVY